MADVVESQVESELGLPTSHGFPGHLSMAEPGAVGKRVELVTMSSAITLGSPRMRNQ